MSDLPNDRFETPFGEPDLPVFGAPAGPEPDRDTSPGVEGRLAVVTGAAGAIGAALAQELTRRGAMVCLLGRSLEGLDETADRCGPGARTAALQCDLAVGEEIVAAVEFVRRLDRPVDLVVHAAGLQAPATVTEGTVESLDEHYLLNVRGPYLLSQQLLALMADRSGRFAFVSAPDEVGAGVGDAHHAITHAAARVLADELRVEAARRGIGVVNVVADGGSAASVDPDRFAAAVATSVVEALSGADLEVSEVRVRGVARPIRSEQR